MVSNTHTHTHTYTDNRIVDSLPTGGGVIENLENRSPSNPIYSSTRSPRNKNWGNQLQLSILLLKLPEALFRSYKPLNKVCFGSLEKLGALNTIFSPPGDLATKKLVVLSMDDGFRLTVYEL